ncbi:hypothetical protein ACTHGU_04725 [Chitinophagaceae bacterium MMS25-I14]
MTLANGIPAIRLYNTANNDCAFETGMLSEQPLPASHFHIQSHIAGYEKVAHPAPTRQYVITIKGKLLFTVTDGNTFVIEPGVVLVAEDVNGHGHNWELVEGNEWLRVYIPIPAAASSGFTPAVFQAG